MNKDLISLLGLLGLAFIVLPVGIMWILYFVPKKLGYLKVGRNLAFGFLFFYLLILLASFFVK